MSLERLELTPFSTILGDIITDKKTGYLTVVVHGARKVLYWSLGELVMIASGAPEDSLADLLVRRELISVEDGAKLASGTPAELVPQFHDIELASAVSRQSLLREWVSSVVVPLFSADQGTAAFTEDEALPPEQRIFLSTPAILLDGVRSITNGLILRRSLGDIKREIAQDPETHYSMDRLPLHEAERTIAESLREPKTIEAFLRDFPGDSLTAARVVIGMLALGVFTVLEAAAQVEAGGIDEEQTQKDLQLLAMLGSGDPRSLAAVALARQLPQMDYYRFLDVPRAALRAQIVTRAEEMRRRYDPAAHPALIKEYLDIIQKRIDEAARVLADPAHRAEYDKLLAASRREDGVSVQQRLTRRSIAEQNFRKGKELAITGDYWGAIVLLRQAVEYAPDHADAWHQLGTCLEQNPKWRRDAVEAYQRALSLNPNLVDALLSLGDLYKTQGMISRAIAHWEDALQIDPESVTADKRLKEHRRARR